MLLPDIATYLQTQTIGTKGTDLFQGTMPDTPDNCISLYEYGGGGRSLTLSGTHRDNPGLQVRVRNSSYEAGRNKIEQIITALHGIANQLIGSTQYLIIKANQSPESMGRDTTNRAIFVVNFSIIKEVG